ncbi:uncharacterized protein [Nicotiana sylvestris]|uniref:uncharacterized protein n=1 Tax=Nicotiana sylvestris TaxID=4096 RepID=UPI00388CB10E
MNDSYTHNLLDVAERIKPPEEPDGKQVDTIASGKDIAMENIAIESILRKQLWADLVNFAGSLNGPWVVIGDFNVISEPEEKIGGNPYRIDKSFDFIECLSDCSLQDGGFLGNIVTWCNNKGSPGTIWKRLDRMVYNSEWFSIFNRTTVTHLANACSDHVPLLIQFSHNEEAHVKYFKFLNFWTDHADFLDVVKSTWKEECNSNSLWIFHQKLKKTTFRLSSWSREAYGDIHEEPKRLEFEIVNIEVLNINDSSDVNRTNLNKTRAEYIRYLKIQDSILRQKARVKWLKDGDSNSAYFHNVVKDKRRRLNINKIQNEHYQWVEGTKDISEVAVRYFQGLFCQKDEQNDFSDLDFIEPSISEDVNSKLIALPSEEELKVCVLSMDPDSSPGPDDFTAKIFKNARPLLLQILKLNHIASLNAFKAVHMNKKGPIINHLAVAEDIILFSSGCRKSLGLLMEAITDYERVSGQ